MANKTVYKANFPILGILGLIFITLKLCGVIAWSWLWVLAPFWIPLAFALVCFAIVGIIIVIEKVLGK